MKLASWISLPLGGIVLVSCGRESAPTAEGTVRAAGPSAPARPAHESSVGAASTAARFTLVASTVVVGQSPLVRLEGLAPKTGERYWLSLVPSGRPDSESGLWAHVDPGVGEAALAAALQPGSYEVRLHEGYPTKSYNCIHRAALRVEEGALPDPVPGGTSAPDAKGARFALVQERVSVHQTPLVRLEGLAPEPGERYWLSLVSFGRPDSESGQWQHVDAGVAEAALPGQQQPGRYEVRLHEGYPTRTYHCVHRAVLFVDP